jgi:hypothetical protein
VRCTNDPSRSDALIGDCLRLQKTYSGRKYGVSTVSPQSTDVAILRYGL